MTKNLLSAALLTCLFAVAPGHAQEASASVGVNASANANANANAGSNANAGTGTSADTSAGAGRSEEHTSELQSLMRNSYADFCVKKNKHITTSHTTIIYKITISWHTDQVNII